MLAQEHHQRIETAQHMWVFDRLRRRFSRLPRDRDPDDPMVQVAWQPYHDLAVDAEAQSFTVLLDALGTRLLHADVG